MKKSASHITILFAACLLLALGSCASRKKTVTPPQPAQFEWLTAHIDMEVETQGASYSNLTGQMRMRRDSVVWASVSTLGIEVVRAKMTADSIWVLNRLEKTYLAEPVDSVAYALNVPVSLALVQYMLLGNPTGCAPEENQVVELDREEFKGISAKIKYSDIKLNEPTTFPCKITSKMERLYLVKRKGGRP